MIQWWWMFLFTALGAVLGWTYRGLLAERQEWRDEEERLSDPDV